MINSYIFEGKNLEDNLNNKLNELNLKKEDVFIKIDEIEGKLFKSKKYKFKIFLKNDILLYIKDYLKEVSKLSGIPMNIEIREKDEIINIMIASENSSIMIGKDGRTINSLELLLKNSLKNLTDMNIKIILDSSNYKY
ncbi:MAG TPA: KH domain-containing protein, partial [Tenericutes bacterium]|nr:KH domain-containing protein [Mycoplasmatota bacterium]